MSDISKCNGENCALKKKCYRFTAPSSEFWQSWCNHKYNNKTKTCDFYWEVTKQPKQHK